MAKKQPKHKKSVTKKENVAKTSQSMPQKLSLKKQLKATPSRLKAAYRDWKASDSKIPKYRSFRLQKRIKPEPRDIPTSFVLLKESFAFLFRHKWKFLAVMGIYVLIYVAAFRSPITTDVGTIKNSVKTVLGETTSLKTNVATLGAVIETSSSVQGNGTFMAASIFLMSLIYIWMIRQIHTGEKFKARDAYYQGTTPLISGFLVVVVGALQLLPFGLASFMYGIARTTNLFASGFEDLAFFTVTILIALLSSYWLTSTLMAFYIVTIPGVYPRAALKAAKSLVQFQRFRVFKRIIGLPLILGIAYTAFLLLAIRFFSSQLLLMVEVLQILALPLVHVYLYKLYKALL